jgi:ubiquinone/menaquinone biosynthesis C-methylase UbiE
VTEEVLRAFPQARVTLQDYSQPMLDEARRRLAPFAAQVGYAQCDLRDIAWTDRVGGPFDLAVSAIAIHNLGELAAMADCYRGIARVLKPGALFLDYDLFERFGGIALHTRMLWEAGFARVDLIWHQSPVAILAAHSAPAS